MLRIGLTGNIGSGKTMVSEVFKALGIPVFHADDEARKFYSDPQILAKIREVFGGGVFSPSGELDRKAVASIVFSDNDKLEFLNGMIHPLVREKYRVWCGEVPAAPYSLYEAAILFESGHYREMDKVICVVAPEELRIKRVTQRDKIPAEDVRLRMSRQWSDEKKASLADYVVVNDGTQLVIPQVMRIHAALNSEF